MYRIFKKKHDRAATSTEARARRPRRQRLAVEALEGRQLMAVGLNDFLVNVKTPGAQSFSDNASSANGMSVAVWSTDGFGDVDIHAQLYSASGLRVGPGEHHRGQRLGRAKPACGHGRQRQLRGHL